MLSSGQIIAKSRKSSGLTQQELAERIGVSRQTIAMWEINKQLPTDNVVILASRFLGIDEENLLLRLQDERLHNRVGQLQERYGVSIIIPNQNDGSTTIKELRRRIIMVTFPIRVPEIEVELMPNQTLTVECCDWHGLLLEVGAEGVASFYYYPDGLLLYLDRTCVATRLKFHGHDCLEIHWQTWEPGSTQRDDMWLSTSYHILNEEGIRCVRYVHRESLDMGDCSEPSQPLRLSVGMTGGGLKTFGEDMNIQRQTRWSIPDVARVAINGQSFRCLRKLSYEFETDKTPARVFETFVAENGRTLLERGYKAEGIPGFDELKKQPELEVKGVTYRLWFDMILDHVLATSE